MGGKATVVVDEVTLRKKGRAKELEPIGEKRNQGVKRLGQTHGERKDWDGLEKGGKAWKRRWDLGAPDGWQPIGVKGAGP